jgi:hypothetical protein
MSIECRVWSSTTYFDTRVGEQRTRANTSAVFAHLSDKLATARLPRFTDLLRCFLDATGRQFRPQN